MGMQNIIDFGWRRILTHALLALFTAFICWLTTRYVPLAEPRYILTLGMAYAALLLIALSLLIGPFKLLSWRRNPVNINLRRDIGIWAGITGALHVFFGLQIHLNGQVLLYFFKETTDGLRIPRNLFTLSNYIGLGATILLLLLTFLSNDYSLRRLKGKRWKGLQRLNYLLAALTLAHTLGYQQVSHRELTFIIGTLLITLAVLLAQVGGFLLYRYHARRHLKRRTT